MAGAKKKASAKQASKPASKRPSKKPTSKKPPPKTKTSRKQAPANPTFHPFNKLPPDIRVKIWKEALPGARVVELEYTNGGGWWAPLESKQTSALQCTNHEAREVFLKHYSLLCRYGPSDYTPKNLARQEEDYNKPLPYPAHYLDPNANLSDFPACYFDPDVDILYLGPSTSYQFGLGVEGRYSIFSLVASDGERYNATYTEESIAALAKIACLSRLRFLAVQWAEWHFYHRSRLGLNNLLTLPSAAVRNDVQLLARFPALERMSISKADSDWLFYTRSVSKGRQGAPMPITFQDVLRNEECRRAFQLYNGSSLEGWNVEYGFRLTLRGGRRLHNGTWGWDV